MITKADDLNKNGTSPARGSRRPRRTSRHRSIRPRLSKIFKIERRSAAFDAALRAPLTSSAFLYCRAPNTVKKAREQQVDTTLYSTLAESGLEMSKKLGGAGKHTPAELVTRLIHLFTHDCADKTATAAEDSGAFDWHVCGSHVAKHFAEAPSASFMNGPMDAQVKLRAAHQRRRAEPLGPVTTADAVDDTNAEQQTDHAMKRMVKVMKERKSKKETLTMEELAVNPSSFAQFVENVFTLSFLVKDGEAGLAMPEAPDAADGGGVNPVVKKTRKPEENLDVERATFVMHLDVKGWKALTAANGGRAGAMPHRDDDDEDERELRALEDAPNPSPRAGSDPAVAAARDANGDRAAGSGSRSHENGAVSAGPAKGKAAGKKRARAPPQDVTNSQEDERGGARRRGAVDA